MKNTTNRKNFKNSRAVSVLLVVIMLFAALPFAFSVSANSDNEIVYAGGKIKATVEFAKDIPEGVPCYLFEFEYDGSSLSYAETENHWVLTPLTVPHPDWDQPALSCSAFTAIGPEVKAGEKLVSFVFDVTKEINANELSFSYAEFQLYNNDSIRLDESYLVYSVEVLSQGNVPDEPTTEAPTTEPVTEPTTEAPTTEPVTEPTTEAPTTEPVTEPTTEAPTTEPTTEPVTEPTTEAPTTEPVTESTTEAPTTEPVTEPETTVPTEPETTVPTEPETTVPTEPETTVPTEPETTEPTEPETTVPTEPTPGEPKPSNPTDEDVNGDNNNGNVNDNADNKSNVDTNNTSTPDTPSSNDNGTIKTGATMTVVSISFIIAIISLAVLFLLNNRKNKYNH